MAPRCFIGLGSNLNQPAHTIREALEVISDAGMEIVNISSLLHTAPIGQNAGAEFINAVAELYSELPPLSILKKLHAVEMTFGRERHVHWGPRTLDLDLLIVGEQVIDRPEISLPHPACWYRRFVLEPLFEIAPEFVHPVQGGTVADLLAAINRRPLPISFHQTPSNTTHEIEQAVINRFRDRVTLMEYPSASGNAVLTFELPTGGDCFKALKPTTSDSQFSLAPGVVLVPGDREATTFVHDAIASALGTSQ